MKKFVIALVLASVALPLGAQHRLRDYGIVTGVMKTGQYNAITDVPGVKVGQVTIIEGDEFRTGVTAIVPHEGNLFKQKTPAAIYVGNGFGKLAGITQVQELGNIETPIILTNTLNVAEGIIGAIEYTLENNPGVRSVNAVVGETNDGGLNNIQARRVTPADVCKAIAEASDGPVQEGNVGAGTGTVAFGLKAGIGTSSRVLPASMGGYTVGVLVQANFGGVLEIAGAPIGQKMENYPYRKAIMDEAKGSCMIVVATDAPVDARNLERMAKRAMMGLARTGGIAANGSGDYVIAFSNYKDNLVTGGTRSPVLLDNDALSPLFLATIEATAEAIWNSLFGAETMTGHNGTVRKALDREWAADIILNHK